MCSCAALQAFQRCGVQSSVARSLLSVAAIAMTVLRLATRTVESDDRLGAKAMGRAGLEAEDIARQIEGADLAAAVLRSL